MFNFYRTHLIYKQINTNFFVFKMYNKKFWVVDGGLIFWNDSMKVFYLHFNFQHHLFKLNSVKSVESIKSQ